MEETNELRSYIKQVLKKIKFNQQTELKKETLEEHNLRKLIRNLLSEVKETSPHELTGINVLEKLLGNIMPVIETGYKSLTTDPIQRESYGAHILRAVQNLLSIPSMYFNLDSKTDMKTGGDEQTAPAPQETSGEQNLEEVEVKVKKKKSKKGDPDEEKFIDINKNNKEEETQPNPTDPMTAFQEIQGEDHTGRSFALETFKKVQKQVLESYSTLSNPKDREVFEEYLITNIKLYLKRFEEELSDKPPVPTTPSFEAAAAKMDAGTVGAGTAAVNTGAQPETPPTT
jgi:hypothetical protein